MQVPQQQSNHSSEYEDAESGEEFGESEQVSFPGTEMEKESEANQAEPTEPIVGCEHYQRRCQVEAPCCKIFYWCKLCHDALYKGPKANWCKTERMQFENVTKVKCQSCQQEQEPSDKCIKCSTVFGKYTCLKCKLYQNDPKAVNKIFHCDKCGMCRKGNPEGFKHCDGCGYCVAVSETSHKCFEIGESECPVCLEVLKYSTQGYVPMKCGHLIHSKCLFEYIKTDCNCPICGMAMQNMSKSNIKQIDELIKASPEMPEELKAKKVNIICNECLHKTMSAPFHFYGIKCQKCESYNTKMM